MILPDEPHRDRRDDDPVVQEVRRIRGDLAARFDYDLERICEHARQRTEAARLAGRRVVSVPVRPKGESVTPTP